ncbi:hypothetical protein FRUB_02087 [Fimbriiglobus ruber]|uniref:Uncharacterized protein n=1 Tax=Fimbriiglobus ruber TaxID=1908690 RepID=A0A225E6L9_9BACT|nr:hypothetical protein FRUB_02087 [Fimbriiglobus ruber]
MRDHLRRIAVENRFGVEAKGVMNLWHLSPHSPTDRANLIGLFWKQIGNHPREGPIENFAREIAVPSEMQQKKLSIRVPMQDAGVSGHPRRRATNGDSDSLDLVAGEPEVVGGH